MHSNTAFVLTILVLCYAVVALFAEMPTRSGLFIGWFGPRGIGTLVLGVLMVQRGELEQAPLIGQVVAVVVTLSLVVHSLTDWPGIRWLAAEPAATPAQTPP